MKRKLTSIGTAMETGTWKGCRDALLECGHRAFLLPTDAFETGDDFNCTRCDAPPKRDLSPFAKGLR